MALVELRGAMQGQHRPHRLAGASNLRATESPVCLLQVIRARRMPPDHEVGIGSQTRHVIRAADDDVLGRQLLGELLDLIGDCGPILGSAPLTRKTDHIV